MRYSKAELETMLRLPDAIRRTYQAMLELENASAGEVAEKTGRARAYESMRLNQLVTMGLLTKRYQGKRVIFVKEASK